METYIATCISGLEEFVAERLKRGGHVRIVRSEGGLVEFVSDLEWGRFQSVRYVTNCFMVLRRGEAKHTDEAVRAVFSASFPITKTIKEILAGKRTFALVTAIENETVRPREAVEAEKRLARLFRLREVPNVPSLECWAHVRHSGWWYLCIRLTSLRKENKSRESGELRSDIANIMTLISHPHSSDVVYDPFCGSGTLLLERGYAAPYQKMYAADNDADMVRRAEEKLARLKNVFIKIEDAAFSSLASGSVSTIITDPPWGSFQKIEDPTIFYQNMLTEFARVLRPDGVVVMLSGAKETMGVLLLGDFKNVFMLVKKYDILYSGKKTALYKLRKNQNQ